MAHDLVIRGGTIVDGTGGTSFTGDIAIDGEHITAVGSVDDSARRTIDADGALVTPGFVDIHTHLDAQLAWDPDATSSCWHGVTSVVLGNCGVTFAPVRRGDEAWLAALMESVEDIPAAVLEHGLGWEWQTFPEYLDALAAVPHAIDVAAQVPHAALRAFAMGERGVDHAEVVGGRVGADHVSAVR